MSKKKEEARRCCCCQLDKINVFPVWDGGRHAAQTNSLQMDLGMRTGWTELVLKALVTCTYSWGRGNLGGTDFKPGSPCKSSLICIAEVQTFQLTIGWLKVCRTFLETAYTYRESSLRCQRPFSSTILQPLSGSIKNLLICMAQRAGKLWHTRETAGLGQPPHSSKRARVQK